MAARQGWRCACCNDLLDEAYELDHVIALADGGTNHIENAQALKASCHGSKTHRERIRWRDTRRAAIVAAQAAADTESEAEPHVRPSKRRRKKAVKQLPESSEGDFLASAFLKYGFVPSSGRVRVTPDLLEGVLTL